MFSMIGVFAEFERCMIVERVRAGVMRARALGTRSGKPIGRPRISEATRRAILAAANTGASGRAISRKLSVSEPSVRRVLRSA